MMCRRARRPHKEMQRIASYLAFAPNTFASSLIAVFDCAPVHGVPGIGKTKTRALNLASSAGLKPYLDFSRTPKPNLRILSNTPDLVHILVPCRAPRDTRPAG